MSVHDMKPTFGTIEEYRKWRKEWSSIYKAMAVRIREKKNKLKTLQRQNSDLAPALQRNLSLERAVAHKMMSVLNDDAKPRLKRIIEMDKQIVEQNASFPRTIENCKTIDFHFNKGSLIFPNLPAWVVKTRGESFYIHHLDAQATVSTRETPDHPSTKGSLRFRNCDLHLNPDGSARITDP